VSKRTLGFNGTFRVPLTHRLKPASAAQLQDHVRPRNCTGFHQPRSLWQLPGVTPFLSSLF